MNNIYENNINFKDFINNIDLKKKNEIGLLKNNKKIIEDLKDKIDTDSLILDESELDKLILDYNNKINLYNNKINNIENKYNELIKKNEQILINELLNIVTEIAKFKKLDLILTEKNYFMISDKIDLTNEITSKLNEKNLVFNF